MTDYHKFQECFKKLRSDGKKGEAYKECLKKYKDIESTFRGRVLPDGKPKHDLYNLTENEDLLTTINKLLEQ